MTTINQHERRHLYTASVGQTIFPFGFEVLDDDEIAVNIDGTPQVKGTGFTVTGAPGTGNVVLLTAAVGGEKVLVYGDRNEERLTDFASGPNTILTADLNQELSSQQIQAQQLRRDVNRCLHPPLDDDTDGWELGNAAARAGKYLYFADPSGEPELAELLQSGTVLSRSVIANLLYPDNYIGQLAETSAGVLARITDRGFAIGSPYRYGYVDGASDNRLPIQDAINVCAWANLELKLPGGEIKSADNLYGHYDASLNPGYPSASRMVGRLSIVGQGVPDRGNLANNEYRGSVIHFTVADKKLSIGTGTDGRALRLFNFGIHFASAAGYGLEVNYMPQWTSIGRLVLYNDTGPHCGKFIDIWVGELFDIAGYGLGGAGQRIWFDSAVAGGGDVLVRNVNGFGPTGGPVPAGSVGLQFGAEYDAGRTAFVKNWTLIGCQGKDCEINGWIRAGVGQMTLIDCWEEGHGDGGSGFSNGWKLSDSAGFQDSSYSQAGLIRFVGGVLSSVDTTAGNRQIEIGQATGTPEEDRVGNVIIDGMVLNQLGSNNVGIYCHNVAGNGERDIKNLVIHNNGGLPIRVADEAQYGAVNVHVLDPGGIAPSNLVKSAVGGSDTSRWLAAIKGIMPQMGAGTFDYSNAKFMPTRAWLKPTGGALTVTLAQTPKDQQFIWHVADEGASTLTIDPGTENLNGATTDQVIVDRLCALIFSYRAGTGYELQIARRSDELVRRLPTATTAQLADVTHAVNTSAQKVEGACVFNSTTNLPVYAAGNADADVWVDATGSTAHSPV